jgi:hypothetical protein
MYLINDNSPSLIGTMYTVLAMGQVAARQAELESDSTNIATDNASLILSVEDAAET